MGKSVVLKLIVFIGVVIAMVPVAHAGAGKRVIHLTVSNLSTYQAADANLGEFHVLQFDVPSEVRTVRRAYLELFVDVTSRTIDGYTNDTPVIEVYALKAAFSGTLDPNQFEPQTLPLVRNVVLGQNRRIVIDITGIVKSYMKNAAKNHGLIIGSLTEDREGIFSIRRDAFSGQGVARITFLY